MTTRPKNPNLAMQDDDQDDVSFDATMVHQKSALQETFSERTVVMPRSQMPDYVPPAPKSMPEESEKPAAPPLAPKSTLANPRVVPIATARPARTAAPSSKEEVTNPSWVVDPPSWKDIPVPPPSQPAAPAKIEVPASFMAPPAPKFTPSPSQLPQPAPSKAPVQWQTASAQESNDEELKLEAPSPVPSQFASASIPSPHSAPISVPIAAPTLAPPSPPAPPPMFTSAALVRRPEESKLQTGSLSGITNPHAASDGVTFSGQTHSGEVPFDDVIIKTTPLEKFKALPRRVQVAVGFALVVILILVLKSFGSKTDEPVAAAPATTPKVAEVPAAAPAPPPPSNTDTVLSQFDQAFFKTQGQARGD